MELLRIVICDLVLQHEVNLSALVTWLTPNTSAEVQAIIHTRPEPLTNYSSTAHIIIVAMVTFPTYVGMLLIWIM